MSVSAKDLETGREQSITVTATSGLTEDELQKLVDSSQNYMVEVRASAARVIADRNASRVAPGQRPAHDS